MDISSVLVFASDDFGLSHDSLNEIIKSFGPSRDIVSVSRATEADNGWQNFLRFLNIAEMSQIEELEPKRKRFGRCTISDAVELFETIDLPLYIDVTPAKCRIHSEIYDAVETIEKTIRRDFQVSNIELVFGWHDLFNEGQEGADYQFIGRTPFSLRFWGWGVPDAGDFERAFFKLQEVSQFKATLENITANLTNGFIVHYN